MSGKQRISNNEFLKRVNEYLPAAAAVPDFDGEGKLSAVTMPGQLTGNTFYLLDGETMLAASHAIEDLAIEERHGYFLASFQDFSHFTSHRERYCQLAAVVDAVVVIGIGKKPRPCRRLKFVSADGTALRSFWVVIYQGRRTQAMVLSRQTNETRLFARKSYFGFYTFDTHLINRVRRDLDALLGGSCTTLVEFDRLRAIDLAAKQIRSAFHHEQLILEAALSRMQIRSNQYKPELFEAELARSLQRLQHLTRQVPALFKVTSPSPIHD